MIKTVWAQERDKEEIIDFCDYVFSKAHEPHDFTTLLPKLYGAQGNAAPHHFTIREEGKLLATLTAYPVPMVIGGESVMTLGIGSVSVHPRAKGRGFMQVMLDAVDEKARELGADFAVLGGQRQRYAYYGYVCAGYAMNGTLEEPNVRHGLKNADTTGYTLAPMTQEHVGAALALHTAQPSYCVRSEAQYLDILRTWKRTPFVVLKNQKPVAFGTESHRNGRCTVGELQVTDEAFAPVALKLLSQQYGTLHLTAAPWEKERAALISSLCEDFSVTFNHQYKVYHPDHVRKACRALSCGGDSLAFTGFDLPLPLFVASADAV